MALSAPTLTAPPGFALWSLRRASTKGACPPPLILGAGGRCSSRQESTETYLISMYVSTRGTRDGGLYTCRRSPKTDRLFVRSRSQKPRPFSCRCKRGAKATHPASPVSRASRYNTLHLASKVVCQRGDTPPFGNPRPHQSINQSIISFIIWIDRSNKM